MTSIIIDDNFVKSRLSQVIRNCLGYVAFSRELRGKLLQKQAREVINLLSEDELLPQERIGLCLADDNLSAPEDFIQRRGRLSYDQ